MVLTIIAVLLVFFMIRSQNERISEIEKKIKSFSENKTMEVHAIPQAPVAITPEELERQALEHPVMPMDIPQPEPIKVKEEDSGRLLGRIGIGAVLIGVSFFLKYAFDSNWIGPTGRVMIGIVAGIIFLSLGQYFRKKYLSYSNLLMGGGIVVLYLSLFAAHSFYHLIDPFATGVLMFLVTVLGCVMSLVNEDETISLVSIVGGFMTPFLIASSADMAINLFVYLTILNVGVLGISFFKKWSYSVGVALAGTIINYSVWSGTHYSPSALGAVLGFLSLTFIIFLVASVGRVLVSTEAHASENDYFIVGGNALFFGVSLYILLSPLYGNMLGFVSVLLAVVYGIFSAVVNKRNPHDRALNIFLPGITVVFLSIAVPLQLSGPWIATAWFIEACVLYYIASIMSNRGFQIMGIVVYILGGINLFAWNMDMGAIGNFVPIWNSTFFIFVVAIASAYTIVYFYKKFGSVTVEIQQTGIAVYAIVANVLTLMVLSLQIVSYYHSVESTIHASYQQKIQEEERYTINDSSYGAQRPSYENLGRDITAVRNTSNTMVSILWALYAAILTGIGFARRISFVRRMGLVLFVITAIKVVYDVWDLGQLYRIVSFIVFGLIALGASFVYVKYKDRLVDKAL